MINTFEYFRIFNNVPPASLVAHITRCFPSLRYIFMMIQMFQRIMKLSQANSTQYLLERKKLLNKPLKEFFNSSRLQIHFLFIKGYKMQLKSFLRKEFGVMFSVKSINLLYSIYSKCKSSTQWERINPVQLLPQLSLNTYILSNVH